MTKVWGLRNSAAYLLLLFPLSGLPATSKAQKKPSASQSCESPLASDAVNQYLDGLTLTVPWSKFPVENFVALYRSELAKARANVAQLEKTSPPKTQAELQSFLRALNNYGARLVRTTRILDHYKNIRASKELSKVAKKVGRLDQAFQVKFGQNQKIARLVTEALEAPNPSYVLSTANRRQLEELRLGFKRNGVFLDAAGRARLTLIRQQLEDLGTQFRDNVTYYIRDNPFHLPNPADTDDVPSDLKNSIRARAKKAGVVGALVSLSPGQAAKVLEYVKDRSVREALWRAFSRRAFDGPHNNRPIALEILKLRNEEARLLGYKNFAEETLVGRILNTPEKLEHFLNQMTTAARPVAERELDELRAFARSVDGIEDLKPWDSAYYARLLQVKKFNIDPEELRPYLEFNNVLKNGVFKTYEKLHNVRFQESPDEKPHPDARVVDVIRRDTNEVLGRLYIDPFQRLGEKREGAWQMDLRKQQMRPDGTRQIPIATVTTNFLKPEHGDVFLSPSEVRTVLHEFGHAFHEILSQVEMELLSGTSVSWDLVELPSQLMENYIDFILEEVAEKPATGEKIPTALLQRFRDAQNFQAASMVMAKMRSSYMDLRFHQYSDIDNVTDIYELEKALTSDFNNFEESNYRSVSTSLTHIFSGSYATGFYSYAFADVLVACVYSLFKEAGIWNEEAAAKLRHFILEIGGTEDASVAFRNVYGRDPEIEAYFKQIGLLK